MEIASPLVALINFRPKIISKAANNISIDTRRLNNPKTWLEIQSAIEGKMSELSRSHMTNPEEVKDTKCYNGSSRIHVENKV